MNLTLKITILFIFFSPILSAQYLHQKGKYIADGNNNEIILRGMGLGGWMLQEGYMMETSGFANTQHELKAKIEQLAGKEGLDAFYDAWLTNYCQKSDIDSMAAWGFNSVRLPMHYNLFTLPIEQEPFAGKDTWLTKGFELTDSLLNWCAANRMYLILDLHEAPGGQGHDAAISDYDSSKPSLWESTENRRKTVALWKKLAERYANEPWIGGYDLLNETNWPLSGNTLLKKLFTEITDSIRSVDQNHLIFIEGNGFANDYTGLTPPWDKNMAYSFHKYWNYNDPGSIQWVLTLRNQYNVPIWLGESGENSNPWFSAAIRLFETNKIGWAWWPLKKIGSVAGTITIPKTSGYESLLNFWKNGGPKPSAETAKSWLLEQAEMLKLENCVVHRDVIDAMFRQAQGDKLPKPFKKHTIPGTIYLSDYDLGGNNYAYFYTDTANFQGSTGTYTPWNSGWTYRNDGVDIETCKDAAGTNGYSVGWTNDKEWMIYTVEIDSSAVYDFEMRYAASGSSGKFHLELDGIEITPVTATLSTGGWASWKSLTMKEVILQKGKHQLKLVVDKAGFNINSLTCSNPREITNIEPEILNIKTDQTGKFIHLVPNLSFDLKAVPQKPDFEVLINGEMIEIDSVYFGGSSAFDLVFSLDKQLKSTDVVQLTYLGSSMKSESGRPFATFTKVRTINNSPLYYQLPGTVQAENFIVNNGLSVETCNDAGGGQDMGYTSTGDYLDYLVFVPYNGTFSFDYRVASPNGGSIDLRLIDDPTKPVILHTVTVPNTGGWQSWKTVSASADMTKGTHTIRLYIRQPEFNINWFKASLVTGIDGLEQRQKLLVFPNPANDQISFSTDGPDGIYTAKIYNLQGQVIKQELVHLAPGTNRQIELSNLADGFYMLSVENGNEKHQRRFVKLGCK